jgi:tryptophan-rich sensory protein
MTAERSSELPVLCLAARSTRFRRDRVALIPYAFWVSFATLLTWTIWHLNPMLPGASG